MYVAGVLYVHTEKMGLRCGVGIREQWFASAGLNSANVRQFDSVCWQTWGSDSERARPASLCSPESHENRESAISNPAKRRSPIVTGGYAPALARTA